MNCQIKIGNLKQINKPLLYTIISPDNGEIFTVGIALAKSVEKNLHSELKLFDTKDGDNNLLISDPVTNTFNVEIISRQVCKSNI